MKGKSVSEETSAKVASIAAKGLSDPKSLTSKEIKTIAGSALTQKVGKAPRR